MSKCLFRFLFQKTLPFVTPLLVLISIFLFFLLVPLLGFVRSGLIIKKTQFRGFRTSSIIQSKSNYSHKTSKIMNPNSQNITQDPIIIQFRYSGFYQNRAEFSRLLQRHRTPYQIAIDAFRFGAKVRQNRIKCGFAI